MYKLSIWKQYDLFKYNKCFKLKEIHINKLKLVIEDEGCSYLTQKTLFYNSFK